MADLFSQKRDIRNFIEKHPGCGTRDIWEKLGLKPEHTANRLAQIEGDGIVYFEKGWFLRAGC